MKLWQRIYENCHLLGMPLKFCYRRRILIGPKTVGAWYYDAQCTAKVPQRRPAEAHTLWSGVRDGLLGSAKVGA